ncbi:hypothetical protein BASA81_004205 [Batrachochytrium salamandrivorans]|nr:hypothetical protein BASA81_004205 [Batrachochytrium salamandrivorans]
MANSDEEDEEASSTLTAHHAPLGKHKLLWGKPGRRFPQTCLLGPDWICLLVAFLLIWGVSLGVFLGVPGAAPLYINLGSWVSLLGTTFALFGAAFSDPGIIPKRELRVGVRESQMPPSTDPSTNRTLCTKCLVYRPRGAFHCRDCDACILELDHHCPWTGHCIGQTNMLYFQVYLGLLFLHIIVVIAVALTRSISLGHHGG